MRCQFKKNGILALNHTPTQAPTVSLRGPAQDLHDEAEGRVVRTDRTGRDGNQKCPFIFFILRYIDYNTHIYLYIKNCPDKFLVGFKFLSNWGSGCKNSKTPRYVVFLNIEHYTHIYFDIYKKIVRTNFLCLLNFGQVGVPVAKIQNKLVGRVFL